MPTQIRLTWFEPRKCWKKYHQGKVYYLGCGRCSGKSDLQGYRLALDEWRQKVAQLGIQLPVQSFSPAPPSEMHVVAQMTDYRSAGIVPPMLVAATGAKPTDIRELQALYLNFHDKRAEGHQISLIMAGEYKDKTDDFAAFLVEGLGVREICSVNALVLQAYRMTLLKLTHDAGKDEISVNTANKRLQHAKRFVRWLYDNEYIEALPRGLDAACKAFTKKQPEPDPYTVDEVKRLLNYAGSRRTKLYILLGLNCGYTQRDIATLEHGHVCWETLTISRPRHKSGIQQTHRLWPITAKLLREEMTKGCTGLMLVDRKGDSLWRAERRPNGSIKRNDAIKLAFDRAMYVSGFDTSVDGVRKREPRRFKSLRKTSATEIARLFPAYPHLSSQFLAHGERATRKHYVKQNYELLFTALDGLEKLYDVVEEAPTPIAGAA